LSCRHGRKRRDLENQRRPCPEPGGIGRHPPRSAGESLPRGGTYPFLRLLLPPGYRLAGTPAFVEISVNTRGVLRGSPASIFSSIFLSEPPMARRILSFGSEVSKAGGLSLNCQGMNF